MPEPIRDVHFHDLVFGVLLGLAYELDGGAMVDFGTSSIGPRANAPAARPVCFFIDFVSDDVRSGSVNKWIAGAHYRWRSLDLNLV